MRMIYLAVAAIILLNTRAVCHTPGERIMGCRPVGGGLIHCTPGDRNDD